MGEPSGGTLHARMDGEVDLCREEDLTALIERFRASSASTLALDLTAVTFCDATLLRALVQLHRLAAARGGRVTVTGASRAALRVLVASDLAAMFLSPSVPTQPARRVDLRVNPSPRRSSAPR